jgi:hypothetical protein
VLEVYGMEVEHHMLGGIILYQIARGQNLAVWILIKLGLYNHANLWTCRCNSLWLVAVWMCKICDFMIWPNDFKLLWLCKAWGFPYGLIEDCRLLGCDAELLSVFWGKDLELLKMKVICSVNMSATTCQATKCHISEDRSCYSLVSEWGRQFKLVSFEREGNLQGGGTTLPGSSSSTFDLEFYKILLNTVYELYLLRSHML